MISDAQMAQAAAELAAAIGKSMPDPELCRHAFSPRFEKKMRRLIRKAEHPVFYRVLRSAASIALAVVIGLGSFLAVNAEARELAFGWVKRQYQDFYEYFFLGDSTAEEQESSETVSYQPGWMPEGCVPVTSYDITGGKVYVYTNAQEALIQFTYTSDTTTTSIFVEGMEYTAKDALVNGLPGQIYFSTDGTKTNSIVWTSTDENTIFFISGDFTSDELIKIAESIEKIE